VAKPLSDFYPQPSGRRGVQSQCRACRLEGEVRRRQAAGLPTRKRFDDPPGVKTCRHCLQQLPCEAFAPFPRNRDGLNSWCRRCATEVEGARRRARTRATAETRETERHPGAGLKRCVRCGQVKPLAAFHRYHRSSDGYMAGCADCERTRRGHEAREADPATEGFKTCSACGQVKPLAGFYTDERAPRGVTSRCRECKLVDSAAERRARGIPERPRYQDPPGFKTCRACGQLLPVEDFGREARNRDGLRSWCDKCGVARTLRWHRDNPAAMLRLKTVRRTAEDANEVTEKDWRRLVLRYNGCCAYCGRPVARPHADHVVPVTRGGRHSIGNLLPVCKSCNSSKGDRLLVEWRRARRKAQRAWSASGQDTPM
jgi:HNH endonuclease